MPDEGDPVDVGDLGPANNEHPQQLGDDRVGYLTKYFEGLVGESANDIFPLCKCTLSSIFSSHILQV